MQYQFRHTIGKTIYNVSTQRGRPPYYVKID